MRQDRCSSSRRLPDAARCRLFRGQPPGPPRTRERCDRRSSIPATPQARRPCSIRPIVRANNDAVRRERHEELTRFLRFALIGTIGFAVDASVLRLVVAIFGINLYAGRIVSFLVAATVTWLLNRTFTFRHNGPRAAQWLRFIAANALGAGVNFGTYVAMITVWPVAREYPSMAVGCGSLAGMGLNFVLMKKLVFR